MPGVPGFIYDGDAFSGFARFNVQADLAPTSESWDTFIAKAYAGLLSEGSAYPLEARYWLDIAQLVIGAGYGFDPDTGQLANPGEALQAAVARTAPEVRAQAQGNIEAYSRRESGLYPGNEFLTAVTALGLATGGAVAFNPSLIGVGAGTSVAAGTAAETLGTGGIGGVGVGATGLGGSGGASSAIGSAAGLGGAGSAGAGTFGAGSVAGSVAGLGGVGAGTFAGPTFEGAGTFGGPVSVGGGSFGETGGILETIGGAVGVGSSGGVEGAIGGAGVGSSGGLEGTIGGAAGAGGAGSIGPGTFGTGTVSGAGGLLGTGVTASQLKELAKAGLTVGTALGVGSTGEDITTRSQVQFPKETLDLIGDVEFPILSGTLGEQSALINQFLGKPPATAPYTSGSTRTVQAATRRGAKQAGITDLGPAFADIGALSPELIGALSNLVLQRGAQSTTVIPQGFKPFLAPQALSTQEGGGPSPFETGFQLAGALGSAVGPFIK